jgi:hypothetical protein
MSQGHKGSRLILKNQIIAVDFDTTHFDFKMDASGIHYGKLVEPKADISTPVKFGGVFGKSIAIEDGTTNIFATGGIAQDWTQWTHYGNTTYWSSSVQIDDDDMGKVFRGVSAREDTFLYAYDKGFSLSTGNVHSTSIYLKVEEQITTDIRASYHDGSWNAPTNHTLTSALIDTEWKKFDFINTPTGNYIYDSVAFYFPTLGSGNVLYASMPQVEQRSFPTAFVNGSRNDGVLTYSQDVIHLDSFTVNTWFKLNMLKTSGYQPLFELTYSVDSETYNHRLLFMIEGSTQSISAWFGDGSANNSFTSNFKPTVNEWHMATLSFDGSTYKIFVDGVLRASMNGSRVVLKDSVTYNFNIGSKYYGLLNGCMSDFSIFNQSVSDEEVMAWFTSSKPLYNPYDKRAYAL